MSEPTKPEPKWLVECRTKRRGEEWWLTTATQATEKCDRCDHNIFAKNRDTEHRP